MVKIRSTLLSPAIVAIACIASDALVVNKEGLSRREAVAIALLRSVVMMVTIAKGLHPAVLLQGQKERRQRFFGLFLTALEDEGETLQLVFSFVQLQKLSNCLH